MEKKEKRCTKENDDKAKVEECAVDVSRKAKEKIARCCDTEQTADQTYAIA